MPVKNMRPEEPLTDLQEAVLNIMNAGRLLGMPRMTKEQIVQVITLIHMLRDITAEQANDPSGQKESNVKR